VQRRAGRRVREIGATDGLLLNSLLLLSPAERTGGSSGAGLQEGEERKKGRGRDRPLWLLLGS
jgi:hypothetical protein